MLREEILGPERFDYAFRTYINSWAFKHPSPEDFFRTMNNASGDNLNWFWKGWFYKNWNLDQAVDSVDYINGNPLNGSIITLENNNQMVMPVILRVKQSNGKSEKINLPVEVWEKSGIYKLRYNSTSDIDSVVIDPDEKFPDINRTNNAWPR